MYLISAFLGGSYDDKYKAWRMEYIYEGIPPPLRARPSLSLVHGLMDTHLAGRQVSRSFFYQAKVSAEGTKPTLTIFVLQASVPTEEPISQVNPLLSDRSA